MQQHLILSYLRRPSRRCNHHFRRYHTSHEATTTASSSVVASINWVRDRGLDHAVEKERDLKPLIHLKNLINSEPSKSLPLSIISDNRASLGIPIRSIDFIRKYPSVFEEFLPGGIGIHPHVKLTPETLTLDTEEQLLFESEIQKQDVADRLLKLLMIARINKIPLSVIDHLKWDLGLPNDFTQTIVPQFPDYFQVTSTGNELELVCWSDKLASSVMEKNSTSSFPLQYSRGFEVDKKFKKWVDDWQKLPYISPYENAFHLQGKSDESDKWTVGILHEVLHLLVPKKTEKDNLLLLGEYLGLRSRFKKALLQHPGIFYVSSKLNTHTVVLREAYKRDLLISKPQHPLMTLRSNYIHLMYTVKEQSKSKNLETGTKKQKARQVSNEEEEGEDDEEDETESEDEEDETESVLSDSESEGVITDGDSSNDQTPTRKTKFEGQVLLKNNRKHRSMDDDGEEVDTKIRGRSSRTMKSNNENSPRRNTPNSRSSDNDGRRRGREGRSRKNVFNEKTDSGRSRKNMFDEKADSGSRKNMNDGKTDSGRSRRNMFDEKTDSGRSRRNMFDEKTDSGRSKRNMFDEKTDSGRSRKTIFSEKTGSGRSRKSMFDEKTDSGTIQTSDRRGPRETNTRYLRTESPGARKGYGRSSTRSGVSRTREKRF